MEFNTSRLHIISGRSHRLRNAYVDKVLDTWDGEIERFYEPSHIQDILMGADTPSLFGTATLSLVGAGEAFVGKHASVLKQYLGMPTSSGTVILHVQSIPPKGGVRQAAQKSKCLDLVPEPSNKPRDVEAWLGAHLDDLGSKGGQMIARALIHHRGLDIDSLLSAIDVLACHAGDEPIGIQDVHAVIEGQAEEPLYKLTDAFFSGDSRSAINLLHAGRGLEPQPVINSLINELRKLLCALEWTGGDDIAYHAGLRYQIKDFAAKAIRKRALGLGKRCLTRLLNGIHIAQRDLRRTGTNPVVVLETLILNASRVIRSQS